MLFAEREDLKASFTHALLMRYSWTCVTHVLALFMLATHQSVLAEHEDVGFWSVVWRALVHCT
jgi:hypothetical protein